LHFVPGDLDLCPFDLIFSPLVRPTLKLSSAVFTKLEVSFHGFPISRKLDARMDGDSDRRTDGPSDEWGATLNAEDRVIRSS